MYNKYTACMYSYSNNIIQLLCYALTTDNPSKKETWSEVHKNEK